MEKNFRKGMLKKFIVIVLIIGLLQSYMYSLSYIVKATGEVIAGENSEQNDNNQVVAGDNLEETKNETDTTPENPSENENSIGENDVVAGNDGEEQDPPEENPDLKLPENVENPDVSENQGNPEKNNSEDDTGKTSEEETEDSNKPEEQEPSGDVGAGEEPVVEDYIEPNIEASVTSENTSIYKGYLYANATSDLRYATYYNTITSVNITGSKNISNLTIQDEADKFNLITNTKLALLNDMSYKQSRVSVKEFKDRLGEDGVINLYDANDSLIGTISKDTTIVNEEYVFNYPYQTNSVRFEINVVKSDGNLSIKNDKYIKESSLYSRNQINLFSTINTIANIKMTVGEEVKEFQAEGNINLEETESKMTLDVDKDTLSVENTNDLTINVTLKTDQERYDLFENPEISLEFPSAIEDLEITGINLLYRNALSLDNWNVYTNSLDKKVLNIKLSGSQLEYTPGSLQEGTTVVIYAKLNVNRLTADTEEALKLTYTNKDTIRKSYMLEGKESEDLILSFVGKQEIVKASRVTLANVGTSVSYDDDVEKIEIAANSDTEQTVTITGSIVNNFEATAENVVIVGRIPFVDNIDGNGNNLGSTFNTTLISNMALSGVVADVYYSEDGVAKADDNSWTQDTSDLSKFKSYKIVVREGKLAKGETLRFEYNVSVPAKRGYNERTFGTYTVYYSLDNQMLFGTCTVGIITEEGEISTDDTDQKEVAQALEIGSQVTQNGKVLTTEDSIYERQILKYTVVVKNISNTEITDINIKGRAVNANLYTWDYITRYDYSGYEEYTTKQMKEFTKDEKEYIEFNVQSLKPGESKTFEYEVIVDSLEENADNTEVYGVITLLGTNIEEKTVETIKNKIAESKIELRVEKNGTESLNLDENFTNTGFSFAIYVKNISGEDLKDVNLNVYIPSSLDINLETASNIMTRKKWKIESEKVGTNTKLTLMMNNFSKDFEDTIYFYTNIKPINYNISSEKLEVYAEAEVR